MNIFLKHITVKKTARYFIWGEPGPFTRQVWFVCHGYGFLAGDFLKNFDALNEKQHLVVAPEGLHRFYLYGTGGKVGASWMTKEDRLNDINDYIHYLDDTYAEIMKNLDINKVKVTALGFSPGYRLGCRSPAVKSFAGSTGFWDRRPLFKKCIPGKTVRTIKKVWSEFSNKNLSRRPRTP